MPNERNYKFRWQDAFGQNGPKKLATMRVGVAMSNKDNGVGYDTDARQPQGFFASVDELCHATGGMSERAVKAARKELVEAGWFIRTRSGGRSRDGKSWASEYVLNIPEGMEYVPWTRDQGANPSYQRADPGYQGANPGYQGANPGYQGARWSTPLDPVPLDPGSLDPGSLDPRSIDPDAAEKKIFKASDLADETVPPKPNAWTQVGASRA